MSCYPIEIHFQVLESGNSLPDTAKPLRPLVPLCFYGGTADGPIDKRQKNDPRCLNSIQKRKTPIGECYTINAGGEFGQVSAVGERRGLSVVVDQGPSARSKKRFRDEVMTDVLVNIFNKEVVLNFLCKTLEYVYFVKYFIDCDFVLSARIRSGLSIKKPLDVTI